MDGWQDVLWDYLLRSAERAEKELALQVHWPGKPQFGFTVISVNERPRALVNDDLVQLLDRVDVDGLMRRLPDERMRANWKGQAAGLRAARGKTVSMNQATSTALLPVASPDRTTLTLNVWVSLEVSRASLDAVLSPQDMARLPAKDPTFRDIANALGLRSTPDEGEPESQPRETATPPTSEAARETSFPFGRQAVEPLLPTSPAVEAEAEADSDDEDDHRNMIFFGPPGTGKSYRVADRVRKHLQARPQDVFRITFHPEYGYFDFVGTYRPAVGWTRSAGGFRRDGEGNSGVEEPRVYYDFEPGPLSLAVAAAASQPDETVVLIIEEINRGNCAAIFGDVFQLLDRCSDPTKLGEFGWSEYDIRPSREWAGWLSRAIKGPSPAWHDGKLRLPGNLYLYATMNTSDQSLFPMDTAFRRRWSMTYESVVPRGTLPTLVPIRASLFVPWRELMIPLNERIVEHTGTDDKQMGPWFVKAANRQSEVTGLEFRSKVLFYLWSEVFRDRPEKVFAPTIRTYDALVARHEAGDEVFAAEVLAAIPSLQRPAAEEAPAPAVDGAPAATPDDVNPGVASG